MINYMADSLISFTEWLTNSYVDLKNNFKLLVVVS